MYRVTLVFVCCGRKILVNVNLFSTGSNETCISIKWWWAFQTCKLYTIMVHLLMLGWIASIFRLWIRPQIIFRSRFRCELTFFCGTQSAKYWNTKSCNDSKCTIYDLRWKWQKKHDSTYIFVNTKHIPTHSIHCSFQLKWTLVAKTPITCIPFHTDYYYKGRLLIN